MKIRIAVLLVWALGWWSSHAQAAHVRVHFEQDIYFASGPGDTLDLKILIDGLPETPQRDDPVRGGLFSDAVRMDFDGTKAQLDGPLDLVIPGELNHFGFSPGAFTEVTAASAAFKGNIDQNASPLVPYTGTLLATIQLTNLASGPDSYPLDLEFFRTVGGAEQFFLDGNGNVLDLDLEFVDGLVIVVPEPAGVMAFSALGLILSLVYRRARRRSQTPH